MTRTPSLAVLASGRGSNLSALVAAHARDDLSWPVGLVVSNNSRSGAMDLARQHQIPTAHISARTHDDPGQALLDCLESHHVSVVVLAGYMKLLDPRVVTAFQGRIVNIHPAPLPRFGGPGMYGMAVHEAVLASGATTSGPTVHIVDEAYDRGEQLAHTPVPVLPNDDPQTLADRVLQAEHDLLWRVLEQRFCQFDT